MTIRTLVFLITLFFCNSLAQAESNKLSVNCLKALLIALDYMDHREKTGNGQSDLRLFVETSEHQSTCATNKKKPNEVYLLFQLKYIDKKGQTWVSRPSYRIDIEHKKILEFKGRG